MTATVAEFRTEFPEFDEPVATDEQVQAKLDFAAAMMDVDLWGDLYDSGQLYYAAHLLSVSLHSTFSSAFIRLDETVSILQIWISFRHRLGDYHCVYYIVRMFSIKCPVSLLNNRVQ